MKVKVIHLNPGHHPKFGLLTEGQIVDVPDDFDLSGRLFAKIIPEKPLQRKQKEVKRYGDWT